MQCLLLTFKHCLCHSASAKSASALCHSAKVLKVRQGCEVQSESARQLKFCFRQRSGICKLQVRPSFNSDSVAEKGKLKFLISLDRLRRSDAIRSDHNASNNLVTVGIIDRVIFYGIHPSSFRIFTKVYFLTLYQSFNDFTT